MQLVDPGPVMADMNRPSQRLNWLDRIEADGEK